MTRDILAGGLGAELVCLGPEQGLLPCCCRLNPAWNTRRHRPSALPWMRACRPSCTIPSLPKPARCKASEVIRRARYLGRGGEGDGSAGGSVGHFVGSHSWWAPDLQPTRSRSPTTKLWVRWTLVSSDGAGANNPLRPPPPSAHLGYADGHHAVAHVAEHTEGAPGVVAACGAWRPGRVSCGMWDCEKLLSPHPFTLQPP